MFLQHSPQVLAHMSLSESVSTLAVGVLTSWPRYSVGISSVVQVFSCLSTVSTVLHKNLSVLHEACEFVVPLFRYRAAVYAETVAVQRLTRRCVGCVLQNVGKRFVRLNRLDYYSVVCIGHTPRVANPQAGCLYYNRHQ